MLNYGDSHCVEDAAGVRILGIRELFITPALIVGSLDVSVHLSTIRAVQVEMRPQTSYATLFSIANTSRKLFRPDSRFSMIPSASSSGSGRLSRSVRLLSLSQNPSRLVLSRAFSSS